MGKYSIEELEFKRMAQKRKRIFMQSTANENLNLPLLKEVEVRDSQKEGGAPGGKRSKNPGAAMRKYKTPGERREKTQGQKVD